MKRHVGVSRREIDMAKASDLRNKLGTGGTSGGSLGAGGVTNKANPFTLTPQEEKKEKEIDPHIKSGEIDKGHDARKGAHKSLGGAGSAGGRPKV